MIIFEYICKIFVLNNTDNMEFTAQQISDFVQGRIEGNPNAVISSFAKIEAGKPGAISFLSNPKYSIMNILL